MSELVEEAKAIREEYIRSQVNRRIDFRDGDATAEQIEQWENDAAGWWASRWPTLAALPHLTDDGAGSGEPAVAAGEAGSIPAGNPAPSSPHLTAVAVEAGAEAYWDDIRYEAELGWSDLVKDDGTVAEIYRRAARVILSAVGEGATPAIDREALRAAERQQVAQSIRDEAVDEAVDGFVQLTAVIRMCEEAGR